MGPDSYKSLKIMVNRFPSTCHRDNVWQKNDLVWYILLLSLAHYLLRSQGELLPPAGLSWSHVSSHLCALRTRTSALLPAGCGCRASVPWQRAASRGTAGHAGHGTAAARHTEGTGVLGCAQEGNSRSAATCDGMCPSH